MKNILVAISLLTCLALFSPAPVPAEEAAVPATAPASEKPAADPGVEEDVEQGRKVAEAIEKEYKVVQNKELQARLDRVSRILTTSVDTHGFPFTFKILEGKVGANAFALPGGTVYVGERLFDMVRTDHELAGVLAHEMAHVILRHSKKQQEMGSKYSWYTLAALLLTQSSEVAMMSNLVIMDRLSSYSIEQEKEADITALGYLQKSGHDPVGLLTFLEQLAMGASGLVDNLGVYQTHPYADERLAMVRGELNKRGLPMTRRRASGRFLVRCREAGEGMAEVLIDDRPVLRLAGRAGEPAMSIAGRSAVLLDLALDEGPLLYDVKARVQDTEAEIIIRNRTIAVLRPADVGDGTLKQAADKAVADLKNAIWVMMLSTSWR